MATKPFKSLGIGVALTFQLWLGMSLQEKCGRAKLGHARAGCPYAEAEAPSDDLVVATARLQISQSPTVFNDDHKEKAARRASMKPVICSQPTIRALSRDSSIIIHKLLEPGIMDDRSNEDVESPMIQWKKNIFIDQRHNVSLSTIPEEASFLSFTGVTPKGGVRCLARSYSMEQREAFIAGLSSRPAEERAKPIAFMIPKDDLQGVMRDAERVGFFTDVNSDTGLLVLGEVEKDVKEMRKLAEGQTSDTGGCRGFIKGAVIDGLLAFVGLALGAE